MDSRYDHHDHEDQIYDLWEKVGAFTPKASGEPLLSGKSSVSKSHAKSGVGATNSSTTKKPFTIIMPPPNANDPLHIGHAMFVALEDIMVRYHRMSGESALWLPGTDHAGIETQFVFEKKLKKKDLSRFDFDRETLYKMIWDYVQENSGVAVHQLKKMGASADWSRFTFTLDPDVVDVVLSTFSSLHDDKLIYRDSNLVNYCPNCGTSFSELEVVHKERIDPLFYLKYGPFTIATVRPETKFRDTALAAHPDDKRYKDWIGKTLKVQGLLGPIEMKVIADEEVKPEFGTGIMKVTPAHDIHDFELGRKHNLPVTPIIDFNGRMDFGWYINDFDKNPLLIDATKEQKQLWLERAQKYHGKKIAAARELMVEDMKLDGILDEKFKDGGIDKEYVHNVSACYRCSHILEPLPLPQFYIRVKPLVAKVLEALKKKQLKVVGAGHDKILKHWLENLRDWNISRQIIWGIRIPVWYNVKENPDMVVTFVVGKGGVGDGIGNGVSDRASEGAGDGISNGVSEGAGEGAGDGTASVAKDKVGIEAKTKKQIVTGKLSELLSQGYSLEQIKKGLQSLRAPLAARYLISTTSPGDTFLQETDTFDTWFSSSQWPFATLFVQEQRTLKKSPALDAGQPSSTPSAISAQLKTNFSPFYPTSVMETGYDILPFWVMRMLMLGIYATDQVPFTTVYLHGLVRDQKGQKMSKSKGNVINPLDTIDAYGADALRLALVIRSSAGLDKSVSEGDFKAMRNLTNKIWNAARFVVDKTTADVSTTSSSPTSAPPTSSTFNTTLNQLIADITQQLNDSKIGLAAETVYNQFWHWYCDICIEDCKAGKLSLQELSQGLVVFLKLLHPFTPFVTESIWQELRESALEPLLDQDLLIQSSWPNTSSQRTS